MKKILRYSLLCLLVLTLLTGCIVKKLERQFFEESTNYLTHSCDETVINFEWGKGIYGEFVEQHNSILIPVSIDGFDQKYYFQFDTGSGSFIYANPLKVLIEKGLIVMFTEQDGKRYVDKLNLLQDEKELKFSSIQVLEEYGDTTRSFDTTKQVILGTIGSDFIDNKVAIIDFKNQYLKTYSQRPTWMNSLDSFHKFDFTGRKILLPTRIEGKELNLVYDTGSSAFGLITSKNRYKKYTKKKEKELKFDANSWGKSLPIYHKFTDKNIEIGGHSLNLYRISYVGIYGPLQRFAVPFTKIGGWLGNKPFVNKIMIFDTQKQEFIILEKLIYKE